MNAKSKSIAIVIALVLTAAAVAADDDVCPCPVLGYTWLAEPCQTWNCAASALVMANGDQHTMVVPTTSDKYKWVVLRRVVSGSTTVSPDAPFVVQSFKSMSDGTAQYATIGNDHAPLMLTTVDGNFLVVSLREQESRNRAVKP